MARLYASYVATQVAYRHLRADQRVRVSVEDGQVVIRPVADTAISLEQRLARFDLARHGGEVMAGLARRLRVVRAVRACRANAIKIAICHHCRIYVS